MRTKTQWLIVISYFLVPLLDIFRLDLINQAFYLFRRSFSFQKGFLYLIALLFLIISFLAISKWSERRFCSWLCPHNTIIRLLFTLENNIFLRRSPILKTFISLTLSLLIAMAASFGLLVYFISPTYLAVTIVELQFFTITGTFFVFLTVIIFFLIFLLKQQFCKYACPYGHFQKIFSDRKRSETKSINKLLIGMLFILLFSMITLTFLSKQFDVSITENVVGINIKSAKVYSYDLEIRNYSNKNQHYIINVIVPNHWDITKQQLINVNKKDKKKSPLLIVVPETDFDQYFLIELEIIEVNTNKRTTTKIAIIT